MTSDKRRAQLRAAQRRYEQSEKGRDTGLRYRASTKGMLSKLRYEVRVAYQREDEIETA